MRSLTLVRKNLFRKKLRFALLFVSILIAFLLYGVLASVKTLLQTGGDGANANRMVTMNKINFTQPLPISYLTRIRALPGVAAATHNNWFGAYFQKQSNFMVMFATDPASYLDVYPEIILPADQRETFLKDRTSIIVGKQLADKYNWKVGQSVPIFSNIYQQASGSRSWQFKIAGIFTIKDDKSPANISLCNWEYFNDSRSFGKDKTGNITFLTTDPSRNAAIKAAIDTQFANSDNATDTVTEQQFAAAFVGQLGNIGGIITLVVGASFTTILIIVGNTMVMAVRERTREIGIMKTLGFSGNRIMAMIIGESLAVALIGGFAGLFAAYGMVTALKASGSFNGLAIPGSVWLSAFVWMILLGLATAAVPVWNSLKLNIVTALGRK